MCFTLEEPMSPRSVFLSCVLELDVVSYSEADFFMWRDWGKGGIEGEAGESVRGEGFEHDLCVQIQNALWRWEINWVWLDLRHSGKC